MVVVLGYAREWGRIGFWIVVLGMRERGELVS